MNEFLKLLEVQRWDDHRYYHHSRVNQTLHLISALSFIGAYEHAIVRYAEKYSVSGVLCGHIHTPAMRQIENVSYCNCGDWVESCSAIVEHHDGRLELLNNLRSPPAVGERTLPIPSLVVGRHFQSYDTSQTQSR